MAKGEVPGDFSRAPCGVSGLGFRVSGFGSTGMGWESATGKWRVHGVIPGYMGYHQNYEAR